MIIEMPADIAEDMADKLGIYGTERIYFVSEMTTRIRDAVENENRFNKS